MQKKFLSGLFLIILLNLLVKPFFILGIDAEVQNRVGEAVYGNYFALLNFSLVLNIFLDMGIANYNTRNIAQAPEMVGAHFFRILFLRCGLFLFYAIVCFTTGVFVDYSADEFYLLFILMINQFLVAVIQFSRSNLGGLHLFKTDAIVSVLDRLLLIGFCSLLLWTNLFGSVLKIEWFVYAQTLAYGLTAATSIMLLYPYTGKIKLKTGAENRQKNFSWAIIKKSFPYALLILLMMLYTRTDSVMLERLLPDGDEQAGIYAQGYRYLDAVNMIGVLFAGILLPVFSRLIKARGEILAHLELSVRLLATGAIIVGICGFFYSQELLDLRYANVGSAAQKSFALLILSFIPIALSYIYGTLLTANENLKQLNYMAFGCLVLNVILNLVLIPVYKAEGAAIAMLITQSVATTIQLVLVYRVFRFSLNVKLYGALLVLAAVLIGSFYLFQQLRFPFLPAIFCLMGIGVLTAFALKLLRVGYFKEMLGRQDS